MTSICDQCEFRFEETAIQFGRRMRNKTPKICRDCYRISHAEAQEVKRKEKHKLSEQHHMFMKAKYIRAIAGHVSVCFLMRKFKLKHEEAEELCKLIKNEV